MKKKIFLIIPAIIIPVLLIGFFPFNKIIAWTDEAIKLIQVKDQLFNNGYNVSYLNSLADIIIWTDNNLNKSIFSKFKDKIFLNKELSYVSSSEGQSVSFINWWWSWTQVWWNFINWMNDYYSEDRIAPKDPTSILPINEPCSVYTMKTKWIRFNNNTNTYSSLWSFNTDLVKSDLTQFERPWNTVSWFLHLNIFISNKDIIWVPTGMEITEANNVKWFMLSNVCNYEVWWNWCKNWNNYLKIPVWPATFINWAWTINWANLRWIEMYSSIWPSKNTWSEYIIVEDISFSDIDTPNDIVKVSNFNWIESMSWLADIQTLPYNCKTFSTTDTNPMFVSYFENGENNILWWYTIVEVRAKNDNSVVNRLYLWDSKKWDSYVTPAKNKSYTYWIYSQQDRSNLYNPAYWWNLNLVDWITTTSYNPLSMWEYVVYMQNINRFWFRSSNIPVWFLTIIPPENWITFGYTSVVNPANSVTYNVVSDWVDINFDKNIRVNVNNPWNYDYQLVLQNWTVTTKENSYFIIDSLPNWVNIINAYIKDIAWNILEIKKLEITVDTTAPIVHNVWINSSYVWVENTDKTLAMVQYFWAYHVNDNIFWVGNKKVPFIAEISDNLSVNNITIQYSTSENWVYSNVEDMVINWNEFKFNVNTSFVTSDMPINLYFRAVDKSWNISLSQKVNYFSNRSALPPVITSNNWNDFITNTEDVTLLFNLENDISKFLINDKIYTWYQPYSDTFSVKLPLKLWDNNFSFKVIDMLWNLSNASDINIYKNPTPKNWVEWTDETINFKWWVTTNSINLQRVTPDWSPAEVFSR